MSKRSSVRLRRRKQEQARTHPALDNREQPRQIEAHSPNSSEPAQAAPRIYRLIRKNPDQDSHR